MIYNHPSCSVSCTHCLSLTRCLSHSLSFSLPHDLSLSRCLSLSLVVSLTHRCLCSLSFVVALIHSLSYSFSLTPTHSLSRSPLKRSLCLSLTVFPLLSESLSISLTCLSLESSRSLPLTDLSFPLSVVVISLPHLSLTRLVSLSVSHCLSPSPISRSVVVSLPHLSLTRLVSLSLVSHSLCPSH